MAHKKKNYPERHPNGLMQRFSRIRTAVNKFCGYLAQMELLSGYNETAKIARVKEMYFEFETKSNVGKKNSQKAQMFAFEHCWQVLKYDQKWLETSAFKNSAHYQVPKTSSGLIPINLDAEDTSSTPRTVQVESLLRKVELREKGNLYMIVRL